MSVQYKEFLNSEELIAMHERHITGYIRFVRDLDYKTSSAFASITDGITKKDATELFKKYGLPRTIHINDQRARIAAREKFEKELTEDFEIEISFKEIWKKIYGENASSAENFENKEFKDLIKHEIEERVRRIKRTMEISQEDIRFYGLEGEKTILKITGKPSNKITEADAKEVVRRCPIRWISWEDFLKLSLGLQKRYLIELVKFFEVSITEIAKTWFKGAVTADKLRDMLASYGFPLRGNISYSFNPPLLKALRRCANRNHLLRDTLDEQDVNHPISDAETKTSNESSTNLELTTNEVEGGVEDTNEPSTLPQSDSAPVSEEETGESRSEEETESPEPASTEEAVPPVAESDFKLLPTGEVVFDKPLETEPKFGKIDTFYSLRVELPYEGYCEIEEILRKYRRAGAAKILQASYSDLDTMSLEA